MDTNPLFQAALGLVPPWTVSNVTFDPKGGQGRGQLDIRLDFPSGSRFPCSKCGTACALHDTAERTWRHLDFFQHLAFLHARVPRTDCKEHGVLTIAVPWAREGSGFTMLFEAYVMLLCPELPMAALSRIVGEHDTRLWRIAEWHVADARKRVKMDDDEALVVDETSRAKGQTYVTLFAEPGKTKGRVLFVADGRDHATFKAMLRDFEAHGGVGAKLRDIAMDMSAAFMRGAAETLPFAAITFDRFHVMKLVSEAVDQVRRAESRDRPEFKGTRYDWLRNIGDLSPEDCERVESLARTNLRTTKAWQLRLNLQPLWEEPDADAAKAYLTKWCTWALRVTRPRKDGEPNGFEPMRRAATTIRDHAQGILHYFRRRMTTAVLEGINSIAQAARSRARGYRNPATFKTMIYLLAGRLQYALPPLTHTG